MPEATQQQAAERFEPRKSGSKVPFLVHFPLLLFQRAGPFVVSQHPVFFLSSMPRIQVNHPPLPSVFSSLKWGCGSVRLTGLLWGSDKTVCVLLRTSSWLPAPHFGVDTVDLHPTDCLSRLSRHLSCVTWCVTETSCKSVSFLKEGVLISSSKSYFVKDGLYNTHKSSLCKLGT